MSINVYKSPFLQFSKIKYRLSSSFKYHWINQRRTYFLGAQEAYYKRTLQLIKQIPLPEYMDHFIKLLYYRDADYLDSNFLPVIHVLTEHNLAKGALSDCFDPFVSVDKNFLLLSHKLRRQRSIPH